MARTRESLQEHLRDVCLVTTTPFRRENPNVLHEGGIHQNVDFALEQGIRTLFPCGNTGEFHALTIEECCQVVKETMAAAGSDACIIAGIGHSAATATALAQHAADAGADGVMIVPPVFTFESTDGLMDYYRQILDTIPIPAVLYKRTPALSDAMLLKLAGHDMTAGIKYAVNDLNAFRNIVVQSKPDQRVVWICGTAERWAPFYFLAGAEGFSSGMANFIPQKSRALLEALQAGDWTEALEIRELFVPIEELRSRHNNANNVPAIKYAMDLAGLYGGPVRPPISGLSEVDRRDADAFVRAICPVHYAGK